MDANPFQTARGYLNFAPGHKWLATLASVAAALALLPLFPIVYLFVDLLVGQGRVPAFAAMPAGQQRAFRANWDGLTAANPAVAETLAKLGPPPADTPAGWETRWQAATHAHLAAHVSPAAAEAYLPLDSAGPGRVPVPYTGQLGILGTVAREQGRWSGTAAGVLARFVPPFWDPAGDRPVNAVYLSGLFLAGFLVVLGRGLLQAVASYAAAACAIQAAGRLRRTLHTHGYRLNALVIHPESQAEAGDLLAGRVEQVQDGFLAHLGHTISWSVLIPVLLAVLFSVNVWLTLSLILLGGLIWLVAGQAAAHFRQDARLAGRRVESRLRLVRESLTMMQLVKGYLMERYSQTRLERHLTDLSRATWRRLRGESLSRAVLYSVAGLAGTFMLYLAGLVVLGGELSVAGLAVKAAALAALVYALNRWIAARVRLSRGRQAAADIAEFLDRRGDTGQGLDAEFLQPLSRRLDFVGVSLREPGTGRMILEGVNLSVPAGSKAAVVYADQTEAHALAYLIVRFLDPTAGEVKVDGKNIRWVTYESLRTQVGLVLEQSLTFSDTVLNNIGCGDPGFSLPQIIEAAKKAHAHQFIQHLPYGYETPVGDGGVSLTVGQRFRLALARALLRDPSILLIEEPSEPVDGGSLALIDDAIAQAQPGRTLLFLARRPATVKSADRVFVLQAGKVAAAGSHDELLAGSELYRLLHFKQSLTAAEV